MNRAVFTTVLVSVLAGCMSTKPLPPNWGEARLVTGASCDWINGIFHDEGESDGSYKPSLSRLLDANESRKDSPQLLTLSYAAGTALRIEPDTTSSAPLRSVQTSDYSCIDGSLWLSQTVATNREGVLAYERFTHVIYESSGYLVVKTSSSVLGMMFFIPVIGHQIDYYRFKRLLP